MTQLTLPQKKLDLTGDNYFDAAMNLRYMSNSQYQGFLRCEAKAMAKLQGDWEETDSKALLIGKYIHAWNEGKLLEFCEEHPELYKKNGEFYADYKMCDDIISIIKADKLFMEALAGQKEVIFTAELFGIEWKILIDSYFPEKKRLGDLKVLRGLYEKFWNKELSCYENVFQYRGYYTQVALYSEIERIANNREDYCEPFLAIVTKEEYPDKAIVSFNSEEEHFSEFIRREIYLVGQNIERIKNVKSGNIQPKRCELCDYCRSTKMLRNTMHYTQFALY